MKKNKDIQIKKTKQGGKAILCNLEKMQLQIYNEWGQRIFVSSSLSTGGIALLIAKK